MNFTTRQILTLFAIANILTANGASVSSVVVDKSTGNAIPFAYVTNSKNYTFTNYDGVFELPADDGQINISHISYNDVIVSPSAIEDTIYLEESRYDLKESVVIPDAVIMKRLKAARDKYLAIKTNENVLKNWYYTQLTFANDTCTEFLEALFTGSDGYRIPELRVQDGRWAKIQQYDGRTPLSMTNAYAFCTISPFEKGMSKKQNSRRNRLFSLYDNFEKLFDVTIDKIINDGSSNEAVRYKLTTKEKTGLDYICLTIRTKDLKLLEYNMSLSDKLFVDYYNRQVIKNNVRVTISYNTLAGQPEINYINTESEVAFMEDENYKRVGFRVRTFMSKTDYRPNGRGKKIDLNNNLLHILYWGDFKIKSWDNNPYIKRSEEESGIVEFFTKENLFQHHP